MTVKPVRVLVAEDDETVRAALAALIEHEPSFRLVAVARDATEAVALASTHVPDVALVDVRMPGGGGLAAVHGIAKHSPTTRVVALSAQGDRDTVLEMLQAGVIGYLVKGGSADEIVDSVARAAGGQGTLSVELTTNVIAELASFLAGQTRERERHDQRVRRMRNAITAENAFAMVFQPIVSLADSELVGAEALARFALAPRRGPAPWFAEAEELGLREKLELAAVRKAIAVLPELPAEIFLAVNVSPSTLSSARFHKLVSRTDGLRLVVEITENAAVKDYEVLGARLAALRELGVRVAIDDTGAGFASLTHILRLGPEVIKLDRTLVEAIDGDSAAQALASGIVGFANRSGASIVAEGIERRAQLKTLIDLGVQHGQGYCFAKPGPLPLRRPRRRVKSGATR